MTIISAYAPYGEGGIGRHLATIVEAARSSGALEKYFAASVRPNDARGQSIGLDGWGPLFRAPPLRWRHAWRQHLACDLFDRAVRRQLPRVDVFHGFSGTSQHTFRRARRIGVKTLMLESPTSHVDNVKHQHAVAGAAYPIEDGWLAQASYGKMLREYDMADTIVVSSEYARQSFIDRGVSPGKLVRRVQGVSRRFRPAPIREARAGFHAVYVGRLQVSKGVPVLLDAFAQFDAPDATLTLVGGTATTEMDQYLRRHLARDRRVSIVHGDPLPHLLHADVFVHPSYEDGLALAPLEALACGVPVLVTDHTGMREWVTPGRNGFVIPAGDVAALVSHLRMMRAHPLRGTFPPLDLLDSYTEERARA